MKYPIPFLLVSFVLAIGSLSHALEDSEWRVYRGDSKANQYSNLAQIHAANVHHIEKAWEYHTGDATDRSSIQVNSIMVDGLLYFSTFSLNAVALDAATGEEVWVFKSAKYNEENRDLKGRTRGVVYWESGNDKRIFHFVKNRVYALDAETGLPINSFGEGGFIDLRKHLRVDYIKASIEVTSPGIVYKNNLIVGSRVPEGYESTPGDIRAFDTVTGEFKWIFHTLPEKGEFGYDTWEWKEGVAYGGANPWGGFSLDEERGWVFCATGSPSFDFYGGNRIGINLFGNCVLALDAETGERQWHYQTVHHDLWDYDNPSAPVLATVTDKGEKKDVVVQLTKMGLTFVLDRDTGEPVFPVVEMPVPPSDIPGEQAHPTQPIPLLPPPLNPLQVTEANLNKLTPEMHTLALEKFHKLKAGPLYTPPSEQGTLNMPGTLGGTEWQGASFDPVTNTLFVNSHALAGINQLKEVLQPKAGVSLSPAENGRLIYQKNCTSCHGFSRDGVPPVIPPLKNLGKPASELQAVIHDGRGPMPAFGYFPDSDIEDLVAYVMSLDEDLVDLAEDSVETLYLAAGYHNFTDKDKTPLTAPPWGTMNAIDLLNGSILWQVPLGEYPHLVKQGIRNTGTPNYGGAVATAGGVVFVAGTADEKIRAFDKNRGEVLWESRLPAGGYATPTVYQIDGKQYVVIIAGGGGKNGTKSGDSIVAFALPDNFESLDLVSTDSDDAEWIELFDGKTLDGWVHMNGSHDYSVEDGTIVGRTYPWSQNSFLCTKQQFDNFELEVEVIVDDTTNQGIQFRSRVKSEPTGTGYSNLVGRVWGPQLEIRQFQGMKNPTTGFIYGEAMNTRFLSGDIYPKGHHHYVDKSWNKLRIVAEGPRLRTWVNGTLIDDVTHEGAYKTHPHGFVALQIHGMNDGRTYEMGWRNIRIRPLPKR
ncbi:MAG: DUF1080 domain-containing protein [Verrucomicrobia bacterium]|nr:DUF1080 domain-containing protein [Verrucomicrobiota bacterium]MDA1068354.1 DUF1080 domain-containing protein [Verrucomicrobiota bacterium]